MSLATGEEGNASLAESGAPPENVPASGSQQFREKIQQVRKEIAHRDPATDRLRGNDSGTFQPEPDNAPLSDPEDRSETVAVVEEDGQEFIEVRDGQLVEEPEVEVSDPELVEEPGEVTETVLEQQETPAEEAPGTIKVSMTPRHDNEPELEVELVVPEGVDPAKVQDQWNQMRREGMRRQQYVEAMQEVDSLRGQLEAVQDLFKQPETAAEFVLNDMRPDVAHELARQILVALPGEAFNELVGHVAGWQRDPQARKMAAVEAENARLKRSVDTRLAKREDPGLTEVRRSVLELVPEGVPDKKADRFFYLAMQELANYVETNRLDSLTGPQAAKLIRASGLLEDLSLSVTPSEEPATAAATAPPRVESNVGKDLAERASRRKSAAAAPAGASSSAAAVRFPKGQTVTERIAAVKAAAKKGLIGVGRRS